MMNTFLTLLLVGSTTAFSVSRDPLIDKTASLEEDDFHTMANESVFGRRMMDDVPSYTLTPSGLHDGERTPGTPSAGVYALSAITNGLSLYCDDNGHAKLSTMEGVDATDDGFKWRFARLGQTEAAVNPGQPPLTYSVYSMQNVKTGQFFSMGYTKRFGDSNIKMLPDAAAADARFIMSRSPDMGSFELMSMHRGHGRCRSNRGPLFRKMMSYCGHGRVCGSVCHWGPKYEWALTKDGEQVKAPGDDSETTSAAKFDDSDLAQAMTDDPSETSAADALDDMADSETDATTTNDDEVMTMAIPPHTRASYKGIALQGHQGQRSEYHRKNGHSCGRPNDKCWQSRKYHDDATACRRCCVGDKHKGNGKHDVCKGCSDGNKVNRPAYWSGWYPGIHKKGDHGGDFCEFCAQDTIKVGEQCYDCDQFSTRSPSGKSCNRCPPENGRKTVKMCRAGSPPHYKYSSPTLFTGVGQSVHGSCVGKVSVCRPCADRTVKDETTGRCVTATSPSPPPPSPSPPPPSPPPGLPEYHKWLAVDATETLLDGDYDKTADRVADLQNDLALWKSGCRASGARPTKLRDGFCKQTDFDPAVLSTEYPDLADKYQTTPGKRGTSTNGWYTDSNVGTGMCNINSVNNCAKMCETVEGCKYFSISTTTPAYCCFLYKSCDAPGEPYASIAGKYQIHQMTTWGTVFREIGTPAPTLLQSGFCTQTDFDPAVLSTQYPDLNDKYQTTPGKRGTSTNGWYTDSKVGTGMCNINSVNNCAKMCETVEGCKYFSTSTTTSCYGCFLYKSCDAPGEPHPSIAGHYKIYQMASVAPAFFLQNVATGECVQPQDGTANAGKVLTTSACTDATLTTTSSSLYEVSLGDGKFALKSADTAMCVGAGVSFASDCTSLSSSFTKVKYGNGRFGLKNAASGQCVKQHPETGTLVLVSCDDKFFSVSESLLGQCNHRIQSFGNLDAQGHAAIKAQLEGVGSFNRILKTAAMEPAYQPDPTRTPAYDHDAEAAKSTGYTCKLTILTTRRSGLYYSPGDRFAGHSGGLMQISRVVFKDADGQDMAVDSAELGSTKGGARTNPSQTAMKLIDGSVHTKMTVIQDDVPSYPVPLGKTVPIVINLNLKSKPLPSAYQLYTANDVNGRDPTSWTMECRNDKAAVVNQQLGFATPTGRKTSFGLPANNLQPAPFVALTPTPLRVSEYSSEYLMASEPTHCSNPPCSLKKFMDDTLTPLIEGDELWTNKPTTDDLILDMMGSQANHAKTMADHFAGMNDAYKEAVQLYITDLAVTLRNRDMAVRKQKVARNDLLAMARTLEDKLKNYRLDQIAEARKAKTTAWITGTLDVVMKVAAAAGAIAVIVAGTAELTTTEVAALAAPLSSTRSLAYEIASLTNATTSLDDLMSSNGATFMVPSVEGAITLPGVSQSQFPEALAGFRQAGQRRNDRNDGLREAANRARRLAAPASTGAVEANARALADIKKGQDKSGGEKVSEGIAAASALYDAGMAIYGMAKNIDDLSKELNELEDSPVPKVIVPNTDLAAGAGIAQEVGQWVLDEDTPPESADAVLEALGDLDGFQKTVVAAEWEVLRNNYVKMTIEPFSDDSTDAVIVGKGGIPVDIKVAARQYGAKFEEMVAYGKEVTTQQLKAMEVLRDMLIESKKRKAFAVSSKAFADLKAKIAGKSVSAAQERKIYAAEGRVAIGHQLISAVLTTNKLLRTICANVKYTTSTTFGGLSVSEGEQFQRWCTTGAYVMPSKDHYQSLVMGEGVTPKQLMQPFNEGYKLLLKTLASNRKRELPSTPASFVLATPGCSKRAAGPLDCDHSAFLSAQQSFDASWDAFKATGSYSFRVEKDDVQVASITRGQPKLIGFFPIIHGIHLKNTEQRDQLITFGLEVQGPFKVYNAQDEPELYDLPPFPVWRRSVKVSSAVTKSEAINTCSTSLSRCSSVPLNRPAATTVAASALSHGNNNNNSVTAQAISDANANKIGLQLTKIAKNLASIGKSLTGTTDGNTGPPKCQGALPNQCFDCICGDDLDGSADANGLQKRADDYTSFFNLPSLYANYVLTIEKHFGDTRGSATTTPLGPADLVIDEDARISIELLVNGRSGSNGAEESAMTVDVPLGKVLNHQKKHELR